VQTESVSAQAWWMSLPIGWLIVDILVVNNLRDIEADRAAGKHTLAARFGEGGTRVQYIVLLSASYLLLPVLAFFRILPWTSLLAWLSIPLGWRTWQIVRKQAGRPLNEALAGTGQTTLAYSLLFFVGMLFAG
jgi:1,4-dihydroxy-2-naphthoate octaprenyltransferase